MPPGRFPAPLRTPSFRFLATLLAAFFGTAAAADAQDARKDFRQNCTSCHTIGGGRLTGPDLKDVTSRQKREWLVPFVTNPNKVLDSGDPYALELLRAARGQRMTAFPWMTEARAAALLDLIEAESKLEKSEFVGLQLISRPALPQDLADGEAIFRGEKPLAKGGPACISCHTVGGLAALGGGRLGPDLTRVFERYKDLRTLAQWLSAPATEQMSATFRERPLEGEEIFALTAFFEDAARHRQEDDSPTQMVFVLLGLGGAGLLLALFESLWKNRFRAVRAPLVQGPPVGDQA